MKHMHKLLLATVIFAATPVLAQAGNAPTVGETVLGVEVNVAKVVTSGYSANKLIGATVHNNQKKEVGTVHDLIVATDGEVSLAIVEVGGFIGLGSKYVAVPALLFEPGEKDDVILPQATEAELKSMPAFRYAN